MPVQGVDGAAAPKAKPKTKTAPAEFVSEHGRGGGTGGNDVGASPALPVGHPPAQTDTSSSAQAAGAGDAGTGTGSAGPVDWEALLGDYGLPQDVINELNRIFSTTGDINQAITLAQAYIRSTGWYTQTYPGIQSGINAGLFSDEQGYRAYQSQVNQIYQQYYGRAATPSEIASYVTQGQSVSRVAAGFQANAIKGNLSDPLKGLFSDQELTAFSQEQAGIDTALGQKITTEANLYSQVSTLYKNFYGRDVSRGELDTLTSQGTSPQDVAQQFATQENINAMNPAVKDLFTPEEIKQIALDAAGGTTQNGQTLTALANLATQLNPIYHQYTGAGVSRQEIQDAYQVGTPVDTIAKQFAGQAFVNANKGDIQQTAGAFSDTGQLTDPELKAFGEEQAGLDSPLGQLVQSRISKAQQRLAGVFKGSLAHPALQYVNGRLAGPGASQAPDVGA